MGLGEMGVLSGKPHFRQDHHWWAHCPFLIALNVLSNILQLPTPAPGPTPTVLSAVPEEQGADPIALRTPTTTPPGPVGNQVGSRQTGSLSGDESRDPPLYSQITTREITLLPIFPADDRSQGGTKGPG